MKEALLGAKDVSATVIYEGAKFVSSSFTSSLAASEDFLGVKDGVTDFTSLLAGIKNLFVCAKDTLAGPKDVPGGVKALIPEPNNVTNMITVLYDKDNACYVREVPTLLMPSPPFFG